MHRFLITSLSVHWSVVFALAAINSSVIWEVAPPLSVSLSAVLTTGHALVSVLFLWAAITAWAPSSDKVNRADDVAGFAFAAAALALAANAAAGALDAAQPLGTTAVQIAALGATYLVVRLEEAAAEQERPAKDYSNLVARRLAVGAAHGSMLTRLSKREPDTLETDA